MTITNEVDSTKCAIDFLYKQPSVDNQHIGMTGSSQGGADSIILASEDSRIKALVASSAVFDFEETLTLGGADLKKWKKDGFILLGQRKIKHNYSFIEDLKKYDMEKIIPKIKCPILVLHGDRDETVPVSQGHRLFELLKCEKALHIIKGAGHNFEGAEIEERLEQTIKWFKKWLGVNR
jgi:dipeptidyl aminopeptidase/acylaminoacyl peptidase